MDAQSLVLRASDGCQGWGRLVRDVDGEWFDPPMPVRAIGYLPGQRPAPRASRFKIRVDGADFGAVEHRHERDGAIEGYATIYGTWLGDRIHIGRQTTEQPQRPTRSWSDPPCTPPPGGWPHGMNGQYQDNLDFDLGDLEQTGAAVAVVVFRPSADQAVLVVAASDPAAVEARLRPQLPDRLCVVPSRWTRDQLQRAQSHLTAMAERWGIYQWGPQIDERAQATMTATLVRVTDEIAEWTGGQPDGLVSLDPCLVPDSHTESRDHTP